MEQTNYPLHVTHGYAIPTHEAIAFCEFLRKTKKLAGLAGIEELAKARREVLPYGAFVLERLLKMLNPSEVVFSVFGIREGLIYSLLPAHERRKDPLLSFCAEYAGLRSRSVEHAWELCKWTDALFEPPGPKETPTNGACATPPVSSPTLAGASTPTTAASRASTCSPTPGFPASITRAACSWPWPSSTATRAPARSTPTSLSERLKSLVSKRAQKRARIVAAAVRTAHMLSIGVAGVIDETPLSYDGDKLVLTIPKAYAGLDGERLRRRFELLAMLVEKVPEIRIGR